MTIGVWLVVALLVWLDQALPHVEQPHVGAFLGFIVSGLIAIGTWLGSRAASIGRVLYEVGRVIARTTWDLAVRIAGVFRDVAGLLQRFWSSVLRPFVQNVWQAFERVKKFLEDTFGPVIRFLESVRLQVLKFYEKWLRPIFDTIAIVRRSLQILERLGVEWARELDAKLAELEGQLLKPIRDAMGYINEARDWINRIITLDGLIQRVTLIGSLIRYQRDALNVWWTSIHRPLAGAALEEYRRPLAARTIPAVAQEFRAYVLEGGGPDRARIDEHARDLEIRLRAVNLVIP